MVDHALERRWDQEGVHKGSDSIILGPIEVERKYK